MRLENDGLCIELDAHTGGFSSIYDKRAKHEYVTASDRALLFRLMTPEGDLACAHVDAAEARIVLSRDGATITYSLDGVKAVVSLRLEDNGVMARLRITNDGPRVIQEVIFPWVRGLGPVPGASVVWPNFWMRKIEDPFGKGLGGDHHTWNEWTQKLVARYPAHLASAWCRYGNDHLGLAIEGRHTDFAIMDFFVHKVVEKTREPVRRTLDVATVSPRRIMPGESCELSPVRISVHAGDWHTAADAHREWLETWIRKPDRPAKCAEAIGWHFYFMKHQDGLVLNTYADLPKMAEAALAAGCPYLLVFGWQTGGHDNNYFYRYVANEDWGGAEALRKAVRACREMGVEVIPFFNGTLANTAMPEHKEFGYRWEAMTRAGQPYYAGDWARHNFDAPTRNRAMVHHEICFCEEQRKYFIDSIRRIIQDYGFGNTQLDQISEKMLVCYNEAHRHQRPDYAFVKGLAELLSATRAVVREVNPEGVMVSECLNEFTGQWCDSSWDWSILLPFPEPILYTLPWLLTSHEVDALEFGEVNKAFVYKMHLDMKIDGGDAPITKYPAFAEHVRHNAALRKRLPDYYCYADFRDHEHIDLHAEHSVIAKVFHNRAERKVGIVVAETGGKEAGAIVSSRWPAAGKAIRTESNFGGSETVCAAPEISILLRPYEIRVLCIDLA